MPREIIIDVPLEDPTNVTITAKGFKQGQCRQFTKPIIDGYGGKVLSDTPNESPVQNTQLHQQIKTSAQ